MMESAHPLNPNVLAAPSMAPPPPPPSYAAATQDLGFYNHPPPSSVAPPIPPPHSPTRRSGDDGFSESIDPQKYKTRLCQAYMLGMHCTFGGRCAFAHGQHELRQGGVVSPAQQAPPPPPPPPSYQQFAQHQMPGLIPPVVAAAPGDALPSPQHSRPESPRVAGTTGAADATMSPTRPMHPRNSLPGSPVTAGDQAFPGTGGSRFRNEPYSPTGFVLQERDTK